MKKEEFATSPKLTRSWRETTLGDPGTYTMNIEPEQYRTQADRHSELAAIAPDLVIRDALEAIAEGYATMADTAENLKRVRNWFRLARFSLP